MEQLLKLRQKAKHLCDKYHMDIGTLMTIEMSQAEAIDGIEEDFAARRKAYRDLSRQIVKLEKELNAKPDEDVEIGTCAFYNPFVKKSSP